MSKTVIKINSAEKIMHDKGLDDRGRNTLKLRTICDRFMDAYIPMESGMLKNNKSYPKVNQIRYNVPYAHYHYIGKKAIRCK